MMCVKTRVAECVFAWTGILRPCLTVRFNIVLISSHSVAKNVGEVMGIVKAERKTSITEAMRELRNNTDPLHE